MLVQINAKNGMFTGKLRSLNNFEGATTLTFVGGIYKKLKDVNASYANALSNYLISGARSATITVDCEI